MVEPMAKKKHGLDRKALDRIALCGAAVEMDGRLILTIRPKADCSTADFDQMEFDRTVCAAGLKRFIRPCMPSDQPDPTQQISGPPMAGNMGFEAGWVLVEEQSPGIRFRRGVDLFHPDGTIRLP